MSKFIGLVARVPSLSVSIPKVPTAPIPTVLVPNRRPELPPLPLAEVLTPNQTPAPTLEYIIDKDGALVVVIRNWLESSKAKTLHDKLVTDVEWINAKQNLYGNITDIPRSMFVLGDPHVKTYKYSRVVLPVKSWLSDNPLYSEIEQIRTRVHNDPTLFQLLGMKLEYNTCLLNWYRNGLDKIGMHSDKEALGALNAVVTVSLGEPRIFTLKSKEKGPNGRFPKHDILLENGDLVLMAGRCQELWTHGIDDEPGKGSRISLTLRLI